MSFVHFTSVGHFDPYRLGPANLVCRRPLDLDRARRLLAEYPEVVARSVVFRDGYAQCCWTAPRGKLVYEFAYRLARAEGCLAVEQGCQVTYPPQVAMAVAEAWKKLTGR
jgi:hypothetical protein